MRSSLVSGENVVPAQVVVHWSHADELMESLKVKIEARDITQGFEVMQASKISGLAL